jgi:hypothetical protein
MLHFTQYLRKRLSEAVAKAGPVAGPAFILLLLGLK